MPKRILIIDDEEIIRTSFLLALDNQEKYQVDTASSGKKGINKFSQNKYDLVYLDLNMPEMNGIEVLRKIREINKKLPVYIITAFYNSFSKSLQEIAYEGLNFDLINKPLNSNQIIWVTEGALEGAVECDQED